MNKIAVYAGTRNVYPQMVTAAKSLLCHTRMDAVHFLIEDDAFPEPLPDVIRCSNVSSQGWFQKDGPNYRSRWTYMTLMRLAIPDIFQDEERVLWLDVDTIVTDDISQLFQEDLGQCYFGMVPEVPDRSKPPFTYYNAGVMLINVLRFQADGRQYYHDLIDLVNWQRMDFPDQDAINLLCQTRIKALAPCWNSGRWTKELPADEVNIVHFMADRQYTERALYKQYAQMDWRVSNG